jgi:hypothetical protein
MELSDKVKKTLESVDAALKDAEKKIDESTSEAKDMFLKEKAKLDKFIEGKKQSWEETIQSGQENLEKLKYLIQSLEEKLPKLSQVGEATFDFAKKETLDTLAQLLELLTAIHSKMGIGFQPITQKGMDKIQQFITQLNVLEFQAISQIDTDRAALVAYLHQFSDQLKKEYAENERMAKFSTEMTESFNHLKNAFKGLFS